MTFRHVCSGLSLIGLALLAGCSSGSSTTTTADSGKTDSAGGDTASGGDSGSTDSAKVDSGSAVDTGTAVDTGGTYATCEECTTGECKSELDACGKDKSCQDRITCLNKCTTAECQTACNKDIASPAADAFINCILSGCKDLCTKSG